jgi:hypothetical protein
MKSRMLERFAYAATSLVIDVAALLVVAGWLAPVRAPRHLDA